VKRRYKGYSQRRFRGGGGMGVKNLGLSTAWGDRERGEITNQTEKEERGGLEHRKTEGKKNSIRGTWSVGREAVGEKKTKKVQVKGDRVWDYVLYQGETQLSHEEKDGRRVAERKDRDGKAQSSATKG